MTECGMCTIKYCVKQSRTIKHVLDLYYYLCSGSIQNVYHFQDQYYTYTMFDVCGLWCVKYILGEIDIPDAESRNT